MTSNGGFEGRRIISVKFDDPRLDGLIVKVRAMTMIEQMEVADFPQISEEATAREMADYARKMVGYMIPFIISWNLQNTDEKGVTHAVPIEADALLQQDGYIVQGLIAGWTIATAGVAPPLSRPSSDGNSSLAASIPMEPL